MIGIVLVGHGKIAEGMYESSKLFFGDDIQQFTFVNLAMDEDACEFSDKLEVAVNSVRGDAGVLILADLLNGTPCNKAAALVDETVDLITGVNFSLLLELLGSRAYSTVDLATLVETAKSGIINIKDLLRD